MADGQLYLDHNLQAPVTRSVDIGDRVRFPQRARSETKWFHANTRYGKCTFLGRPELKTSERQKIAFIHGVARDFSDTAIGFELAEQFADVVLMCVPGYGPGEMISEPTVENIALMFVEALSIIMPIEDVFIVGESFGGLIGLSMSPYVKRVIAIDPPLTMKDQWPIWEHVKRYGLGSPHFPSPLIETCFGSEEDFPAKSYLHLLEARPEAVSVICGDVPLMPARRLRTAPSLVKSEEVEFMIKAGVKVEVISGGHDLLRESSHEVERAIVRELFPLGVPSQLAP